VKVGFLGGTFDPIHFGHVHIAVALSEAHSLDQVIFCPARLSPDKQDSPPLAEAQDRKEMIKLAIRDLPQFILWDWELKNPAPSYIIDTIRHWKERHEASVFLLLGRDVLASLPHWKEINTLLELSPPLIGSRSYEKAVRFPELSSQSQEKIVLGQTEIPILEISSTLIRKRLFEKRYCGHLIPAPVLEYIYKNQLYS
jgi:nicotinate-nucleotide adenylyltransferase